MINVTLTILMYYTNLINKLVHLIYSIVFLNYVYKLYLFFLFVFYFYLIISSSYTVVLN